jgi:hypothetical protein
MKSIRVVITFIVLFSFIIAKPIRARDDLKNWPAIFYVPHADDEAIAMAAAIAEHKAAGRPVYMVLVSSGDNNGLLNIMNGKALCPLRILTGWRDHPKYHYFNMTNEQLDKLRKEEFARSAQAMGVDKVFFGKDGKTIPEELFYKDYDEAVRQVEDIICSFENLYPGASHKLISGNRDYIFDGGYWLLNQTHEALYFAAVNYHNYTPSVTDIAFYRGYVYRNPKGNQEIDKSDYIFKNKPEWQVIKQNALNCYKEYNPKESKYALGYHSVPDLINAAYTNQYTYVDFLPNHAN